MDFFLRKHKILQRHELHNIFFIEFFTEKRGLLLGNNLTTQRVSTMKGFLVITSRDNVSGIKKLTE